MTCVLAISSHDMKTPKDVEKNKGELISIFEETISDFCAFEAPSKKKQSMYRHNSQTSWKFDLKCSVLNSAKSWYSQVWTQCGCCYTT